MKETEERTPLRRGFACMTVEARTEIAAMGGRKTARKYGKGYMSAIGRAGRRKRTLRERRERKAAMDNRIKGTYDGNPPYDAKKLKASAKAFAERANKHHDAAVNAALQDQDA